MDARARWSPAETRGVAKAFARGVRGVRRAVGLGVAVAGGVAALAAARSGHAAATLFEPRLGAANPMDARDAGDRSAPVLVDLDRDGDLDLVVGHAGTALRYYENTGTAPAPAFLERTGPANPFGALVVGAIARPAAGDLDGDGDLDFLVGAGHGGFDYLENTGSATTPVFVLRTGTANPLAGQDLGSESAPALADLDRDGDLDLVAGEQGGTFFHFENAGTRTAAVFVASVGAANPLAGQDLGSGSALAAGDTDGDGDPDLVATNAAGAFFDFENTGGIASPAFRLRAGIASALAGESAGASPTPVLGDLDADGDLDLLGGAGDGSFRYFESRAGRVVPRTGAASPLAGVVPGTDASASFGDLDGDGDLDLVLGDAGGTLRVYLDTGSATNPVWAERAGAQNPLNGQDVGAGSTPALADLDRDGDLDLVVGEVDGVFNFFENTGTPSSPAFTLRTGAANPLNGRSVGLRSAPAFGDLDQDGDFDLVAGADDGDFDYFENVGSGTIPSFALRVGSASPLDLVDVGTRSAPALGDLDGDGDLDLVAGNAAGTFAWLENTALAAGPVFTARTGPANPFDGEDVGANATPALGDLDGDGDQDVVAGESSAVLDYFENAIVDAAIAALELFGSANPLDGLDAGGTHGSPAFGDLDGDGDLDLVAGEYTGRLHFFENSGSAASAVYVERFGAADPFDGLDVGELAAPVFGDLDGDGDLDALVGRFSGSVAYFENVGDALEPAFLLRTGSANPIAGRDVGYLAAPALGDFDGDGDLDLVVGDLDGVVHAFANTGDANVPVFVPLAGAADPFAAFYSSGWSTPAFGDLDRDGDLDLLAGNQLGQFDFLENVGLASEPLFVERAGPANPLFEQDLGSRSAPALGDLDGDGFLDLVAGNHVGTLQVFALPEPSLASALAFGAAGALALARRRGHGHGPGAGAGAQGQVQGKSQG